jgi:hypothetical protein
VNDDALTFEGSQTSTPSCILLGVSGIHMFMVAIIIISEPWPSAAKLSTQRLGFDPLRASLPRGQYNNSIISSSLPRQSRVLVYTCESVRRLCKLLDMQRGVLPTCIRLVNVRGIPRTAYKCVHMLSLETFPVRPVVWILL